MFSRIFRRLIPAVLILFLVVEALLWIFVRLPVQPPMRVSLTNDLPGLKRTVQLDFYPHMVRTAGGSAGRKADGTVRLLCIGGSATFGILQNADDTWWGQLRTGLTAAGIPTEVIAWGQERAGIAASAVMASSLADEYKPDVIVAMFGFDDVVTPPGYYRYDPEKLSTIAEPQEPAGWKRAVLTVSQSARAVRWWRTRNQAAAIQNVKGRPQAMAEALEEIRSRTEGLAPQNGPLRTATDDPLQEFMDGWKALHDLAERHGASLVMAGEPSLHDAAAAASHGDRMTALLPIEILDPDKGLIRVLIRPASGWIEQEMDRYAAAVELFAAEHRHPWINLNGRISRSTDHFFNDVVLTDAGAAAAAGLLLPVVEPVAREAASR